MTASCGPRGSRTPTRSPQWSALAVRNSALGIHEGQQRHDAGTLDGIGEIPLLLGGEAGKTTGEDLAALGDEFLKQIDVLVVDRVTGFDR